jgi:hypothetical protein
MMNTKTPTTHAGWEPLPDERLPRPTYFPAGLAMGTTLFFWGLITSRVVFLAGVGLFIAALAGWISEIRHERKQQ